MPQFRIIQHTDSGLRGAVSQTIVQVNGQRLTLVADDAIGFLVTECEVYQGRWHSDGGDWLFVPKKTSVAIPSDSIALSILDCYWGERVRLVYEKSLNWEKQTWTAQGHDHCAICWESIGALPNSAKHYAATGHDDVRFHSTERSCIKCYEEHILRNDISFVPTFESIIRD